MKVFIVIAAYNEEKKIAKVVQGLKKEKYTNIIVTDDCSSDKTAAVAKKAGAIVLKHTKNQGQGAALRTGIKEALKRKADVVVTFDADGQHDAAEIIGLVTPIKLGEADVVLGSRFLGQHPGMPWYKWVTLKGSILVERVVLGVKLSDVHNGFRAFSAKAARKIKITRDRMAHASEIVYEVKRKKLSYVEVPVTIEYDAYSKQKGQSIFNSFSILWEILKVRFGKKK
ncbi:glycosyltransferase family 2 protein [Candidatus Woesearchaeota archaeon]|nr:glycosyltransferase family 2 protein [Candidatus Woesearchaeota archaeon]